MKPQCWSEVSTFNNKINVYHTWLRCRVQKFPKQLANALICQTRKRSISEREIPQYLKKKKRIVRGYTIKSLSVPRLLDLTYTFIYIFQHCALLKSVKEKIYIYNINSVASSRFRRRSLVKLITLSSAGNRNEFVSLSPSRRPYRAGQWLMLAALQERKRADERGLQS